ncbi:MAG: prepilin-type N-terminal cleavage/methylation domain-containing protein [Gemmataceae bacterium]|nr:prepilin-type N-terminal cleavage/methylation domain-containing protein [Gemmataceae bacterium]
MTPRPRRPGFTLLELTLVMAVMVILGAFVAPTLHGMKGNADQRAAADAVRSRIADARGLAMEHGTAYRLAVSADGSRLRVAPDGPDYDAAGASETATATARVIETRLEPATAAVEADADAPADEAGGWVTVGTFLPDGTCREDNVVVEVREGAFPPMRVRLRGVTASSKLLRPDAGDQP